MKYKEDIYHIKRRPNATEQLREEQLPKEKEANKCAFSCGRIAAGVVRLTEKMNLGLCDICYHLLDVDDTIAWIRF
jgi:hypothetical protein